MPFARVLMDLCKSLPGARGAVFVDHEGECVQQAIVDETLTAYDLSVAGAYAAPILTHALVPQTMCISGADGITIIRIVREQYAVVLVLSSESHAMRARWALESTVGKLADLM